ncbi:MAG: stage III sporulation protein AF [Clostridia bacterium]|nr:stage III sporulation protein AF [Clostridia bacterium]
MDILKSWALSVTAASVIAAVITFVSPSGNIEKSVKTVTSLFMLLCFIVPLVNADVYKSDDIYLEGISEWIDDGKLKKEVENEAISVLENEITAKIKAYTEEKGIYNSEIQVLVNVSDEYDIAIEKISIELKDNVDTYDIIKFVEDEFLITPEVTVVMEE